MKITNVAYIALCVLSLVPTVSSADETDEKRSRAYVGMSKTNIRSGSAEVGVHVETDANLRNSYEYENTRDYKADARHFKFDASIGVATDGILNESKKGAVLIGNLGVSVEMPAREKVAVVGGNPTMFQARQRSLDIDPYAAGGTFLGVFTGVGALPNGVRVKHHAGETTVRAVPIGVYLSRDGDGEMNYYTALQVERTQKIARGLEGNVRGKAGLTYKGRDNSGAEQLNLGIIAQGEAALRYVFPHGIYAEANMVVTDNVMKVTQQNGTIVDSSRLELQGGVFAGAVY